MKKAGLMNIMAMLLLIGSLQLTACKGKDKDKANDTNAPSTSTQVDAPRTAPVEVSTDDALSSGLKDATKDFPGVNASVNNGEVTLTGTIKRDRLPLLMQSVNALHPKKVNNNLTIQ